MENNWEGFTLRIHDIQGNQEAQNHNQDGGRAQGIIFPAQTTVSTEIAWPLGSRFLTNNCFFPSLPPLPPLPPPPPGPPPSHHHLHPFYGDLFGSSSTDPFGLADLYMGSEAMVHGGGFSYSSPFGVLHAELNNMTAQEMMDAKALAASKSHSEAERRRRERINAHFAKLRSLLPSTTKTDKASLLAEVIKHVKELKRQTSEIAVESPLPTESDELTVDATSDDDGRHVIRASLCCDDRSDLLPELIKALKSLRLRALKAEIINLGGRVKNVLVITGENDSDSQLSVSSIQDALKAVMERAADSTKRQRTINL